MKVATSPAFLEACANHPKVLPNISFAGERFTFGAHWADCIGLEWDDGGIVFNRVAPDEYAAHLLFLPKARDVPAKCRSALVYLFAKGALAVYGEIPERLPHVHRVARRAGMEEITRGHGNVLFRLTAQQWHRE